MQKFNINQHPVFTSASEIQELCKPLEKFGITNFCYIRINESKRLSYIGNNPKYAEQYFKRSYYNFDIHMDQLRATESPSTTSARKYILWDNIELEGKSEELYIVGVNHGICHTFSIIEYELNAAHYFHFSTDSNNSQMNQIYLNNLETLTHFIRFFKDSVHASKSLSRVFELAFELDRKEGFFSAGEDFSFREIYEEEFDKLISGSLGRRYYINTDIYLTQKEIQILKWLSWGKTAHEVSLILEIKKGTVDSHVANMKKKTNCYTLFQLGEFLANSDLGRVLHKL